jgi:hypothetical protein
MLKKKIWADFQRIVEVFPKKMFNMLSNIWVWDSVADPDPGSGAFLTPGSGIRNRFFPDPGSQTHTFESLVTIFWAKSSIIL